MDDLDLPELTRLRVEQELTAYCDRKVPLHVRDQVRLAFDLKGTHLTLFEERAPFGDGTQWTRMPIAQFRFDPASAEWTLYCRDRRERWQPYRYAEPAKAIGALLHAVDADQTRIFWG